MGTSTEGAKETCQSCPHWAEGCGVFRAKRPGSVHLTGAPWLHSLHCPDGRWKRAIAARARSKEDAEAERRAVCEACDDLDWVPEAKCVAPVGPRSCNPCRIEPWRKMARCPRGRW